MTYHFDFSFLAERWPAFLEGAWLTIQLTVVSIALGFVLGTLCACCASMVVAWCAA
jgi:polar amino acid transport system permease protein